MAATLPAAVCEWLQLLPTYFDVPPNFDFVDGTQHMGY